MVGRLPSSIALANAGITAAYSELGSCRGPNTLKYRNDTVGNPYTRVKVLQYCSAASLLTA